ncbi:hypothetical protein [Arthrobacter sp. HS15c]|uniref:hypothetical protein n=1 Tax=Arthrobacter sp. HS15c TaxID=3230279 RepID=UPI00346753DE
MIWKPERETHEPADPVDWPHGHVAVTRVDVVGHKRQQLTTEDVNVSLTEATESECIAIDLAGTRHFLHSTTARELSNMLQDLNGLPVAITIHGVEHSAGGATARVLSKALLARINEWNRTAIAGGALPV